MTDVIGLYVEKGNLVKQATEEDLKRFKQLHEDCNFKHGIEDLVEYRTLYAYDERVCAICGIKLGLV